MQFNRNAKFDVLPEDRYELRCLEAKLGTSKSGNPKISATFEITSGDAKGRKLWNEFSLVQAASFNLLDYFDAADIKVDENTEYDGAGLVSMMVDSAVTGFVSIKSWQGKPKNELGKWGKLEDSKGLFD